MIKMVGYVLVGLCTVACKKDFTLTKQKYTDVILDLQVAETAISNSNLQNKDSLRKVYHDRICDIHGFKDLNSMKKALEPLRENPELMLEITKSMSTILDQLADSILTKPYKPE